MRKQETQKIRDISFIDGNPGFISDGGLVLLMEKDI